MRQHASRLAELQARLDIPMVLISHDPTTSPRSAIVQLSEGRVQATPPHAEWPTRVT